MMYEKHISFEIPEVLSWTFRGTTFRYKPLGCKGDIATVHMIDYDITLDVPLNVPFTTDNTQLFTDAFMHNQKYLDDTNGGDKIQLISLASAITGELKHVIYDRG